MATKQTYLKSARIFAQMMDNQFSFLGIKFGIDNIVGLVPGVGDALGFCFSFYLIWVARQMELPQRKISQMISNLVLDMFLGSFPVVGDIFDVVFKANMKNLKILEEHAAVIEGEIL